MLWHFASRLIQLVVVLLLLSIVTFILMKLAPGDPVLAILQASDGALSQRDQETIREELGLNTPIYVQYGSWLRNVLNLDLGKSLTNNREVWTILMERLPATVYLFLGAIAVLFIFSVPLGWLAAKYKGRLPDTFSRLFAILGASIPSFWLGLLLVYVFSYQLNWLPTMGSGTIMHLILPSVTLGFVIAPEYIRLLRAGLIETLSQDYILAAKSRGITNRSILFRHAMPAALMPIVSLLGISMGALMAGSVVTESLFGWPGLGSTAIEAIRLRDYPVIQGYVMLSGFFFLATNWLSDIGLVILDPRIRLQKVGRI
ncbi:nickel ABC transporter permease [Paenibacillus luteus]|uniref:nickel ABC transporter permease n=1 Tax=Paenibacillus luteus TaxID=2545753 RepID=UPI001144AD00|nr:nickel ABC transporter permease [Paenibacillus luteus]